MELELTFKQIKFLRERGKKVLVETPSGFSEVGSVFSKKMDGVKLKFDDNSTIECADTHNLLIDEKWKTPNEMRIGDFCVNKFGEKSKQIMSKEELPEQEWIDFEVLDEFESYLQNGIIHHNSGKSAIIYILMTLHARKKRRGLLIVPNVGLAEQMKTDFVSYGMKPEDLEKHFHTIYAGKEKNFEKLMTVTTWQSAILMNNYDFNILDYVLVDECLHPESLIETSRGKVRIKNLKEGELVLTRNEETDEFEYKPIKKIHKNLSKEKMFELATEDGRILKITGNHKVYTHRGWIRVDELELGDSILDIKYQ